MNIELYIGDRLCDIGNPEDLGIYLKRVFIKPSELSVKDAQKSYEISLPATAANNEIFNYTNIEEVQGKFKVYDKARLYIDGILILDGKFRMSQITRDAYIGNLGVPAPKTVKDIFGETMMNQAGKWLIPFEGVQDITTYNTGGHEKDKYGEISPCIFPLVLYKLLQKEKGSNSKKDVLDGSVKFSLYDFPPSVNCVHLLRKLFDSAKCNLTGTALADERIKNLYVSYQNANDYEMPWNANIIKLSGNWTNYDGSNIEKNATIDTREEGKHTYPINLFNATNSKIAVSSDDGFCVGKTGDVTTLTIPHSGLYKIELTGNITLSRGENSTYYFDNGTTSYRIMEPKVDNILGKFQNSIENARFELKLLRNTTDLSDIKFDNTFYEDNRNQKQESPVRFFPRDGQVNFVDPKQNKLMLCGFAWGYSENTPDYKNPLNTKNCNPMAISGGKSWNKEISDRSFAATASSGYKKIENNQTSDTDIFKVILKNTPVNTAYYAVDYMSGEGAIHQIVWLDKGDSLSLTGVSDQRTSFADGMSKSCWLRHNIHFDLSITPFRHNKDWLTIDDFGASDPTKTDMNWNDNQTFNFKNIDLTKFLPTGTKVNDWIDNFCKTFNLNLENKENNNFDLNIKKNHFDNTASVIDLDLRADVRQCTDESLKLPSVYELGFTVDTNEEGYYETMDTAKDEKGEEIKVVNSGDKGGGPYYTGSTEEYKVSQSSGFSYNWFKKLYDMNDPANRRIVAEVPVITDNDIWRSDYDYDEMRKKEFYDKAQRLWYPSGVFDVKVGDMIKISASKVSNSFGETQKMVLNYHDKPDSILRNNFLMMVNSDNNYTVVECYLTAQEYANLNKSLIKLNGDLYHPAEVDGYDPLNKKKCRLKLIRKLI